MDRTERVCALAREAGFDLCGVARAEPLDPGPLRRWVQAGHHAGMAWMARSVAVRCDPRLLLPGARAVIALAVNYYTPGSTGVPGGGRISRYAWGRDYHKVLGARLRRLRRALIEAFPGVRLFGGTDAVPIAEKVWAERAGLGWIGKNGNLITRRYGSWVFLATILTDLDLSPTPPHADYCGSCEACLEACPTAAIVAPGVVDARRCLSFHTIEHDGPWPDEILDAHSEWLFGCDACQEVCPWSLRFAVATGCEDFAPRAEITGRPIEAWISLDDTTFDRLSRGGPLRRAGADGLRRSAAAVAAAVPDRPEIRRALEAAAGGPHPATARHARRTLDGLVSGRGRS
ncbi:MAG: tRNA epoxyqueuosine(34) reductase QueG [Deltaproteobacteria bacterium]|nr:MAG: tRNA epoxyqueuosine(34) reductase QueG [Deltaproteobacteria bacterium]